MPKHKPLKIALLPGDGIGEEVLHAAVPVFSALGLNVSLHKAAIGWSCWQQEGNSIPDKTWDLINSCDTALLGAITSKPQREAQNELPAALRCDKQPEYISPIIQLRQRLDLFANVRPCYSFSADKGFDFCIIRENTEGLYAGFDYRPIPQPIRDLLQQDPHWSHIAAEEISCSLRLQSRAGLIRIFQFAFKYAQDHGMKRVTLADKPNVLRQSGHFARELFEAIAANYPAIQADILNVDAVALWIIKRPEAFGVIVAENMFADILSDVGAGVMGGLGLAPSGNLGCTKSYFEPVHGSAPHMPAHHANPCAMFLSIAMLLEHFAFTKEAGTIRGAVSRVIQKKQVLTYDLGGCNSTEAMAQAILDQCHNAPSDQSFYPHHNEPIMNQLSQLAMFTSAEISDALDACGVEGALTGINPLAAGLKAIGPAYTVRYAVYKEKPSGFNNAANYIDTVPQGAVLVIDNQGQTDCTVWGAILTEVAQQKKLAGTVVYGAVRDVAELRATHYPLFCKSSTMRSGKNRVFKAEEQGTLTIEGVVINPGDLIFADNNGVLCIPLKMLDDVIHKASNIRRTEQHILAAVRAGKNLAEAREEFGYAQPWLGATKNEES